MVDRRRSRKYSRFCMGEARANPPAFLKPEGKTFVIFDKNDKMIKELQNLLKHCWDHTYGADLLREGMWFSISIGGRLAAAGQLIGNTLWNLCTNPEYRKRGFARNIIIGMLWRLCSQGEENLVLFVDKTNTSYEKLVRWYTKLGFTEAIKSGEEIRAVPDGKKMIMSCYR